MNFTEFFNFKTKPCTLVHSNEESSTCSFYHNDKADKRRPPIDFSIFLSGKRKKEYKLEELHIYIKEISISPELDRMIHNSLCCLNQIEHRFHILNYKSNTCFFENYNIQCKLGKYCNYIHKDEQINPEILKFNQFMFETFKHGFIRKKMVNQWMDLLKNLTAKELNPFLKEEASENLLKPLHQPCVFNVNSDEKPSPNFLDGCSSVNTKEKLDPNKRTPFSKSNNEKEKDNSTNSDLLNNTIYKKIKRTHGLYLGQSIIEAMPNTNDVLYLSDEVPQETAIKVIFAMMNSHSGTLIFGADKENFTFKGVRMNRRERDYFKQEYNIRFRNYLNFETCVKYKFFDLLDKDCNLIEDLCVLYIKVKFQGDNKSAFHITKKRSKDGKMVLEESNEYYKLKDTFLNNLANGCLKHRVVSVTDVESLKMRGFVDYMTKRLDCYYKNK